MSRELKRPRGPAAEEEYEAPDYMEDEGEEDGGEPSQKKGKMSVQMMEDDDDEAAVEGSGYKPSIDLSIGGDEAWKRPKVAPINPATDSISKGDTNTT